MHSKVSRRYQPVLICCLVLLPLIAIFGLREDSPAPAPTVWEPAIYAAITGWTDKGAPTVVDAPVARASALPDDLARLPELAAQRTAQSATFQREDGNYTTLFSLAPLHYLDGEGHWQPIDARIAREGENFVVTDNEITSRAGLDRAWLAAGAGDVFLNWEAQELGVRAADDGYTVLATALADGGRQATLSGGRQRIDYHHGWSDPLVGEAIVSEPGSVEHLLVLHDVPAVAATPRYLEMQARLDLPPDTALWADGRRQDAAFSTRGALHVRRDDGGGLVLDPVVAFEQARRDQAVAGEYVLTPGDRAGSWLVTVRTPWAWWADPARRYPAVLDPTMRVLRGTGGPNGMAWVNSNGDWFGGEIRLGAHLPDWNTTTKGYIQFRDMPALINNNTYAPNISQARLEIKATLPAEAMPHYSGSEKDWEHLILERRIDAYYVGACPGSDGCPANFTLSSGLPTVQYAAAPLGSTLFPDKQKISAGPAKSSGTGDPIYYDVTTEIQNWYNNYYTDTVDVAPMFAFTFPETCNKPGPYNKYIWGEVRRCLWYHFPVDSIQLRIDHQPRNVGGTFVNEPGIPSYHPQQIFENTDHVYNLQWGSNTKPPQWAAVAVRANHKLNVDPALDASLPLSLYPFGANGDPLSTDVGGTGKTSWLAFDGYTSAADDDDDFSVRVRGSQENDFSLDRQRGYTIQATTSKTVTVPSGAGMQLIDAPMLATELITIRAFQVEQHSQINATLVTTYPLRAVLLTPAKNGSASGAATVEAVPFKEAGPGRTAVSGPAPRSGWYAIALINDGPPSECLPDSGGCEGEPGEPAVYLPDLQASVCPQGTYFAERFAKGNPPEPCQPILLPTHSQMQGTTPKTFSPSGGPDLTIWNKGGFVPRGAGWCTTNEGEGAPIIVLNNPTGNVGQRHLAVVQGSVGCTRFGGQ